MQILILGGTSFVGRAIAVEAVARGHVVMLLNRGTKPAPAGTTSVIGDRLAPDGGLSGLGERTFDAVVDTWSAEPSIVTRAVEGLAGRVGRYIYISSLSVYSPKNEDQREKLNNESTPLFDISSSDATKLEFEYPYNKRAAEVAVEKGFPAEKVLIVRPGVILGPHEAAIIERGRLTWWLTRLRRGGRTLAPGPSEMGIQFVDARDLAAFVVQGIECETSGAFNLIGEAGVVTMGSFLEAGREVTGERAELIWKTPGEIREAGISGWTELPVWIDPESEGYNSVYWWDCVKARAAGLRCRGLGETVKDTWEWMENGELKPVPAPDGYEGRLLGLSPEKEKKALGD
ncbi:hypothetical protein QBC47DRAFT_432301, partial [Echria macrotheca]